MRQPATGVDTSRSFDKPKLEISSRRHHSLIWICTWQNRFLPTALLSPHSWSVSPCPHLEQLHFQMAPLLGMEHIFKKCLLNESEGPGLRMAGREVGSQVPASSALPNAKLERS